MFKAKYFWVMALVVLSMVLTQCTPAATPAAPTQAPTAAKTYKLAAILPGVITDADYNTLAYVGISELEKATGIKTAYSESVPVPDVDRAMREYIDSGFNIIWTHGGQFVNQTVELARQFPDVEFIAEGDAPVNNPPANLWFIDRNFQVGFYAIGALAAKQTKTGKIGYIGGQTLPFSYAEVHAIQQALKDMNSTADLKAVWVGDFNDPTKARQVADALIGEGCDVLMGSLNLGMFGVFESVKAASTKIWVTAKYTDKTAYAPANYLTSVLYDFSGPLKDIVGKIQAGEKSGYYPLGFATGVALQSPLKNVAPEVQSEMDAIVADLKSGKIQVVKDISEVK